MEQEIIDRAVEIAIDYALKGIKVQVIWAPPKSAMDDPAGSFVVIILDDVTG